MLLSYLVDEMRSIALPCLASMHGDIYDEMIIAMAYVWPAFRRRLAGISPGTLAIVLAGPKYSFSASYRIVVSIIIELK